MKTKNILFAGLVMLILLSCKSEYGKIIEAQKQVMFTGIKGAPNHIKYSVKFEIYKPLTLKEVAISANNQNKILKHFTVKNLTSTQTLSNTNKILQGKYILETTIPISDLNQQNTEKIIFKIETAISKKTYTLMTKVVQGKSIFMQ